MFIQISGYAKKKNCFLHFFYQQKKKGGKICETCQQIFLIYTKKYPQMRQIDKISNCWLLTGYRLIRAFNTLQI